MRREYCSSIFFTTGITGIFSLNWRLRCYVYYSDRKSYNIQVETFLKKVIYKSDLVSCLKYSFVVMKMS